MQNDVRMLVDEGRLELLNAGWSMHDEACPHYEDMINNMMIGHDFVTKEFGAQPRIGWQIDPFGHSNAHVRLLADMGYDAFFFARLDYQDKEKRMAEKTMEFVWRPMSETLNTEIFAHTLYYHYSAPPLLDFDTLANKDPFVDDETLETYNAEHLSLYLLNWIEHQAAHYQGKNIMMTMGDDFRFMNAEMYFGSSDRMIAYFNEHIGSKANIEVIYSTPSMYIDAIHAEDIEWTTKTDDMFPYADDKLSYWTGYFTSRANDKEYVRRGSRAFHSASKLFSLAAIDQETTDEQIESILDAKYHMLDALGV